MKSKFYINGVSILICLLWMVSAFPQEGWERLEDMPQATNYYGSCFDSINEKAYIFGGQGPSETLELLATTQIYDFKTDKWSLGANMLNAASSFSAEIVNGKIYLVGEYLNPKELTNAKEYDPVNDTWTTKGQIPEIFYAHGTCVYDGLIYSFGGRDVNFSLINSVRIYEPITDTWSELSDMPYLRDKSAVCIYKNEIYLFGDNPSLKYTPSDSSWAELNAGICDIVAYAVPIIYGDTILLFGGYKSGGSYPNPSNEMWAYSPLEDTLVKLDIDMPFNRFTRGYIYQNYVYLFGGHFSNTLGSVTNEVWRFDLESLGPIQWTPVVSIKESEYDFRGNFIFKQNYPNPFSGSTVLSYQLLEPAFVNIDIHDVLGKKVATLVNEYKGTGEYEIEWNTNSLSPGIYFGLFNNGETQRSIKMVISK